MDRCHSPPEVASPVIERELTKSPWRARFKIGLMKDHARNVEIERMIRTDPAFEASIVFHIFDVNPYFYICFVDSSPAKKSTCGSVRRFAKKKIYMKKGGQCLL